MQQYLLRNHLEVTRRFDWLQLCLPAPVLHCWVRMEAKQPPHVSVSHSLLWTLETGSDFRTSEGIQGPPRYLDYKRHSVIEQKISLWASVRIHVSMNSWTYSPVAGLVIFPTSDRNCLGLSLLMCIMAESSCNSVKGHPPQLQVS